MDFLKHVFFLPEYLLLNYSCISTFNHDLESVNYSYSHISKLSYLQKGINAYTFLNYEDIKLLALDLYPFLLNN